MGTSTTKIVYVQRGKHENPSTKAFCAALGYLYDSVQVFKYPFANGRKVSDRVFWDYLAMTVAEPDAFILYEFGVKSPSENMPLPHTSLCIAQRTQIGASVNQWFRDNPDAEDEEDPPIDRDSAEDYDGGNIVAVSDSVAYELMVHYGVPTEKILILHYGTVLPTFDRNEYDENDSVFYNPDQIVIGFLPIWHEAEAIVERLQANNKEYRFAVIENLDDLKVVDVFIHLPVYEGSSFIVLECLGYGIPTVATETGLFAGSLQAAGVPRDLLYVVGVEANESAVYDAIRKAVKKAKNYRYSEFFEFVESIEDTFSLDGFLEEWKMLTDLYMRTGSFDAFREWAIGG